MIDSLDVFAAAREAGDGTALWVDGERIRYEDLAERVRRYQARWELPDDARQLVPLAGSNTLETVVALFALLQARRPVLLLHPRQTALEQRAVLDAVQRAGPLTEPDAAVVIHTSGTTGAPRGVVLTRAALRASAQASAANLGWQDDDCWGLAMPLARVGGLSILTRCLIARRAVALAGGFDAKELPHWVEQRRITLLSLVPTMLAMVLDEHPRWQPPAHLRALLIGGAAASPRLLQRAAERQLPIIITYGCTETCSQVVTTPYAGRFEPARHGAGTALPGAELRIRDGRIEVRGPMRMAGYLGEPALAREAWFDTGDLGEIDAAGHLHVHARRADLIVSGGENVYPAEVEQVLEACPGVLAAGVFGVADETWGQIVAAALVLGDEPPSDRALAEHLAARLAPAKRPRRLCVVSELPLTGAGKLDRAALQSLAGGLRPLASVPR